MLRGILYTVFGAEYEKLAVKTIKYSRQYTDLPICVITNILDRSKEWGEINDITFVESKYPQVKNRMAKTKMIDLTPFDETLYLYCDSVIQMHGI